MPTSPVLIFHIATASIGLLSGPVAMFFRKGSPGHRFTGNIFVLSMLCMSAAGAYYAHFVHPIAINVIAGLLTFYLVATGWWTGRRRDSTTNPFDWIALLFAIAIAAFALQSALQAQHSRSGLKDGIPALGYLAFGTVTLLFAAGDGRMILHRGVAGRRRIARHLVRLCTALLIAALSFFLGQQKVFPAHIRGSALFFIPPVLVLISILYWIVRVRSIPVPQTR